jgi:hypothetical protein
MVFQNNFTFLLASFVICFQFYYTIPRKLKEVILILLRFFCLKMWYVLKKVLWDAEKHGYSVAFG